MTDRDAGAAGDTDTARPPVVRQVGTRVRELRTGRELTLDQLSERSGVSRRMITMLEAGETNVSIGTLDKLAEALGADLPSLVANEPVRPLAPAVSGALAPLWEDGLGSSARLLASHDRSAVTELWQWRLAPTARYDADPDPPGAEELLLVASGRLTVEVGEEQYRLGSGGYLRLPSDRPYAYVNPGRRPTRFIRVAVIPSARRAASP